MGDLYVAVSAGSADSETGREMAPDGPDIQTLIPLKLAQVFGKPVEHIFTLDETD